MGFQRHGGRFINARVPGIESSIVVSLGVQARRVHIQPAMQPAGWWFEDLLTVDT